MIHQVAVPIYVRFEKNPFPDVDPAYDYRIYCDFGRYRVTMIDIPSLEDTTYSSVVLYVVEQDIGSELSVSVLTAIPQAVSPMVLAGHWI